MASAARMLDRDAGGFPVRSQGCVGCVCKRAREAEEGRRKEGARLRDPGVLKTHAEAGERLRKHDRTGALRESHPESFGGAQ